MQPKARMTFRFDGTIPGRPIQEAQPAVRAPMTKTGENAAGAGQAFATEQPAVDAEAEFGASAAMDQVDREAWMSSYQVDIQALEEIIRESDRQPISGFSRKVEEAAGNRRVQASANQPKPLRPLQASAAPVATRSDASAASRVPASFVPAGPKPSKTAPQTERPAISKPPTPVSADGHDSRATTPDSTSGAPDMHGWLDKPDKKPSSRTRPFPGTNRRNGREEERNSYLPDDPAEEFYTDEPIVEDELYDGTGELEHGWGSDSRYSRSDGPSWTRVFVTVIGAIATGGLFGYLLLTLFTGEPMFPKLGSTGADALPASGIPYSGSASATASSAGAVIPLENGSNASSQADQGSLQQTVSGQATVVPGLSLYMLQYGVFKTEESMNEAAQQLSDRGIAAATDPSAGDYRVYAGISPSKSEADALVASLAGTEVYVKSLNSGDLQLANSDQTKEYAAYLKSSSALIGKIAGFTSAELSGDSPAAGDDIQSIRTAHQVWLDEAKAADSWAGTAKQAAQNEIGQLNAAVTAVNNYSDESSASLLRSAQAAAMKAALADLKLRSALQQANG